MWGRMRLCISTIGCKRRNNVPEIRKQLHPLWVLLPLLFILCQTRIEENKRANFRRLEATSFLWQYLDIDAFAWTERAWTTRMAWAIHESREGSMDNLHIKQTATCNCDLVLIIHWKEVFKRTWRKPWQSGREREAGQGSSTQRHRWDTSMQLMRWENRTAGEVRQGNQWGGKGTGNWNKQTVYQDKMMEKGIWIEKNVTMPNSLLWSIQPKV